MASVVLTIKTGESLADINAKLSQSGKPKVFAQELDNYIKSIKGGSKTAVVEYQAASADPVAASATNTLVYASVAAADTFTIGGVVLTCTTSAPGNEAEFRKQTDLATLVANLIATINAHSTLGQVVVASSASAGVVTVTALQKGVVGNFITIAKSSTGMTLSGTALASGAGGVVGAAASHAYGLA